MKTLDVRRAGLDPWPIPKELVLEGTPQASGTVLWKSSDAKRACGVWACTPGRFRWTFTWDENICLVEGCMTIIPDGGAPVDLKPGDIAFFPNGLKTEWIIREPVRDAFSAYSEKGLEV